MSNRQWYYDNKLSRGLFTCPKGDAPTFLGRTKAGRPCIYPVVDFSHFENVLLEQLGLAVENEFDRLAADFL